MSVIVEHLSDCFGTMDGQICRCSSWRSCGYRGPNLRLSPCLSIYTEPVCLGHIFFFFWVSFVSGQQQEVWLLLGYFEEVYWMFQHDKSRFGTTEGNLGGEYLVFRCQQLSFPPLLHTDLFQSSYTNKDPCITGSCPVHLRACLGSQYEGAKVLWKLIAHF